MPTELIQTTEASVPQLPGTTALRVDPAGQGGALLHDLGSPQEQLHVRWMLNLTSTSGSEFIVAGGMDDTGERSWQVVVDPDTRAVHLEIGLIQISADLLPALAWHCIEIGLDAQTRLASLRINGIDRASTTTTLNATRHAWLGGAFASAMTGTYDLDQWVLATEPIGVPVAKPTQDHAGDPRRWLVVYNRADADSCTWAAVYRDRRGVPYCNLCGLDLPTTETISAAEYESLRQQINDYLEENNLREQIVGVLLGLQVPGYADVAGQGSLVPIASYLHTDDTHGLPAVNPLYQSSIGHRPIASDYASVRLTGRIDAASLAEAIALIDRADELVNNPLSHDQGGKLLIDINPDNATVGPLSTQPVRDWALGQGLAQLRLPARVFDAQAPSSAGGEAVVWGWRDAAPPPGFFDSVAGRRAICMQFDPEPEPAVSVRNAAATGWLSSALRAGYAFAAAPSRAYSLSSLPLPHLFFEGLRQGWTVAEAWLVAQPFIRDGLQIVGDPLMPVPFPKAGYDVFGPATRLDQINFDQPLALLHAGETQRPLDSDTLPLPGEAARYLVRSIDAHGRPDFAAASTFVTIESDQVVHPALPAWPVDDNWPVLQRGGQLAASAYWPAPLRSLGVDAIQLVAQAEGEEPVTLDEAVPTTGQHRVVFKIDRPTSPTRYRFSSLQGPAVFDSPWSQVVLPLAESEQPLTVLEASS